MKKNNLKSKIALFFLLISMLVFAGCSDNSTSGKQSGILPFSGVGGGSSSSKNAGSGVSLEFAENRPGNELYKGSPATFAFVFKNYQEHDITDLVVKTKGYDSGYVSGLAEFYNVGKITKASPQAGAGVYVGLVVSGVSVDGFEGNYNFNPSFEYCYSAKTNFREQVCIPSDKNTCDVQVEQSLKQNGPLSVKVDRIIPIDSTLRVDFTVLNQNSGKVVNECFKTKNNVKEYATDYIITEVKLGSATGNCRPLGSEEFKIIGNKASFSCEFSRSGSESYASQISVKLDYKYDQEMKQNIIVRDLNSNYN